MWNSPAWKLLFQPDLQHRLLHGWVSTQQHSDGERAYLRTHSANMQPRVERGSVHSRLSGLFSQLWAAPAKSLLPRIHCQVPPLRGKCTGCHEWCIFKPQEHSPSDRECNDSLKKTVCKPFILGVWLLPCVHSCQYVFTFSVCVIKVWQEAEEFLSRCLP